MDEPIVVRDRLPAIVTVQLGALATVLLWVFYGWMAGVPTLVVALVLSWRTIQMGYVLDQAGLRKRGLMGASAPIPWSQLRGVDLDEVVVGSNEGRSTKLRVRFLADVAGPPPQIVGCSERVAKQLIERFAARGLPAGDHRSA